MSQLDIAKNYKPYNSNSPILDSKGVLHQASNIKKKSDEVLLLEREAKEKKRLKTLQENREKAKQKKQPKKQTAHNIPLALKKKYKLSLKENNLSTRSRVVITRFARLYGRGDYEAGIIAWINYVSRIRKELFRARESSTRLRLLEIHGYYTLKRAKENPPEKILPRNVRAWKKLTLQLLEKPKKGTISQQGALI